MTVRLTFGLMLALAAFDGGTSAATAQDAAPPQPAALEDATTLCPLISPELHRKIASEGGVQGRCEVYCSGCGCKGGPGYRGPPSGRSPNGECVGYANIISICGPPPHERCTRECAIVQPGCQGRAWLKAFAAAAGLTLTFAASQRYSKDGEELKDIAPPP